MKISRSRPPKIVLNVSTLQKGGALQASVSFIREVWNDAEIDWFFVLSEEVHKQLTMLGVELGEFRIFVCSVSPARSISMRRKIRIWVESVEANAVFTFFGPAYIDFRGPHLMGVADGWVTHSDSMVFRQLKGVKSRISMLMLCLYKGFWFKKATNWVVEANCAKVGLARRCLVCIDKVEIVQNSCSQSYLEENLSSDNLKERYLTYSILTLSAYYPHKNLELIPSVCAVLLHRFGKNNFVFNLTLPANGGDWDRLLQLATSMGVQDFVRNIGPVSLRDGPAAYRNNDLVFLPTILETFSANYPEAMAMGRAIVTSDRSFARDVCADAACYFDPFDPDDAAEKLVSVMDDINYRDMLIARGYEILEKLPKPAEKARQYKEILQRMLEAENR